MWLKGKKRVKDDAFDFLCVGVQKAGTTWLWAALSQHPEIGLPLIKEVQFFSKIHLGVYYRGMAERHAKLARERAANLRKKGRQKRASVFDEIAKGCEDPSEAWYRTVFGAIPNSKKSGEFSPDYFCIGTQGVAHIRTMNSNAKIIVFVRDPRSRLRSSLSMMSGLDKIKPYMLDPEKLFLRRGDYASYIPIWDNFFGSQVLYVPFRDIATDPATTLTSICAHIGVNQNFAFAETAKKRNSWTPKARLPDDFLAPFETYLSDQYAFLERRFSSGFCSRI